MADIAHASQELPTPSARWRRRWLFYIVGVPIIGVIYHFAFLRLLGEAVAIGDTAHPVLSPLHGVALTILNFPMMYLWFPIGEWLKPHLTDDGVISLFATINALVWGFIVMWLALFIIQCSRRRRSCLPGHLTMRCTNPVSSPPERAADSAQGQPSLSEATLGRQHLTGKQTQHSATLHGHQQRLQ